jgi:hypothetical protein
MIIDADDSSSDDSSSSDDDSDAETGQYISVFVGIFCSGLTKKTHV